MSIENRLTLLNQQRLDLVSAVNSKGGSLTTDDMFPEIINGVQNIDTGGGCGTIPVHFFDTATGEIISTVLVNSGEDAPLPPTPTHEHLTFKYWKGRYQNVTRERYIGTVYETNEDATFIFFTINKASLLTQTLKFWKDAYSNPLIIDWGDGTTDQLTSSGNLSIAHTWPSVGSYKAKVSCSVAYKLGNNPNVPLLEENEIIEKIYLPSSSKFFAYGVYSNKSMKALVLSDGITALSQGCFSGSHNLKYVALPDSINTSDSQLFSNSFSLIAALLSNAITTTTSYFSNCYSLNYIELPINLVSTRYIANQNNIIKTIEIPDSVTTIGVSTFQDCKSFMYADFPPGVNTIEAYAFTNDKNIDYLIFRSIIPPALNAYSFENLNQIMKIYVPDASLAAYKAATNWSTYAEQIFPLSEYVESQQ